MSVIPHDCPHCHSEKMTHSIVGSYAQSDLKGAVLLACAGCDMPSVALITAAGSNYGFRQLISEKKAPLTHQYRIEKFFPAVTEPDIPTDLPRPVEDILREAEDARMRKKNHGAGLLFGKALDIAFKKFDPSIKGTLHSRIEQLGKSGQLTPELAQWSLDLKVVRNDSTHEEEPFEDKDIADIAAATNLILQYLFTMPAKVKALTAPPQPASVQP